MKAPGFRRWSVSAISLICLVIFPAGHGLAQDGNAAEIESHSFNFRERILEYVLGDSISTADGYTYYWPRMDSTYRGDDIPRLGTARNVDYLGERLSTVRENKGTHCVGITWQVGMSVLGEAARRRNSDGMINGMTVDDMREFIKRWFVKESPDGGLAPPEESGVAYAVESFGVGRRIPLEEAKPGDFVQFWRMDGTGHSSVFLHWVYDAGGVIIGLHYWGSQPQTNGIGTDTEYFSPNGLSLEPDRLLDRERFYVARLGI